MTLDQLDLCLRLAVQQDARISHALAYGSRTQRVGGALLSDEYSDLEYYLYVRAGQTLDARTFLEALTPLLLGVVDEFGAFNAVTPDLGRLELHVVSVARMEDVRTWPLFYPDLRAMLIKDEDGQLARILGEWAAGPIWQPADAQTTYDQTLNWLVFASAVAARGEQLRAAELLTWVRGGLLRLARFAFDLLHFPAATRLAERDLAACGHGEWARQIAVVEASPQAAHLCRRLAAQLGLDSREALLQTLQGGRGRF